MNYPEELTRAYEIYEQIGAGGGGTVFKGLHKGMQKTVVIKKLKGTASASPQDCRTEVDILKNLRHSYLPQVIDFIYSSEGIFTVMDFIPGKSLQNMLDEKYDFTEQEVIKYTRQLCEALNYLHSQNPPIVHGDIKPDNIMITPEGNVCLIDFNISGAMEGKVATTFGYTPGYSAPEQVEAFERLKKKIQDRNEQQKKAIATNEKTTLLDEGKTTLLDDNAGTVLLSDDEIAISTEQQRAWKEAAAAKVANKNNSKEKPEGISIDKRSDIYSLGATIYCLLTGKLRDPNEKKLGLDDVSGGFAAVLAKSLDNSPEKRYQDAAEMLEAVGSVHSKDRKYKNLVRRQYMTIIFFVLLGAASVYCIFLGVNQTATDITENYNAMVREMQEAESEAEFERVFQHATEIAPTSMGAYYEKAKYLYDTQGAAAAEKYIDEVLALPLTENEEVRGELYTLYATCFLEQGNYDNAGFYFERAINFASSNEEYYRNYAYALAYLGELEEAEQILEIGVAYGLDETEALWVRGEISKKAGERETALEYFAQVLEETPDADLKRKVYLIASETFEEIDTEAAFLEEVKWLEEAVAISEIQGKEQLYEHLEKAYVSLHQKTGKSTYKNKATEIRNEFLSEDE